MSAARFVSLLLVALFPWGCDVQNSSDVGCLDGDCEASCLAKGLLGGACGPSGCVCAPSDTAPYEWPEASTDSSDRRGTDSDTMVSDGSSSTGSEDTSLGTETAETTDSGTDTGTSIDTGTTDSVTEANSTDDSTSS